MANDFNSGLHDAVMKDDGDRIRQFVALGANCRKSIDKDGTKLVHIAASSNSFHAIEALLDCGAQIDTINSMVETALYRAIDANRNDMIAFLRGKGADFNHQDSYGITPLIYAIQKEDAQTVEQLISLGASTMMVNRDGRKAIDYTENGAMIEILGSAENVLTHERTTLESLFEKPDEPKDDRKWRLW